MEYKMINPDQDFEPESRGKKSEHKFPYIDEQNDDASIYWQACTSFSPFMSLIDFSFSFHELKKLLEQWLEKRKKPIIYKNNTDETI